MAQVALVQRILPHYRVPFFVSLREALRHAGITMSLIYGQEQPGSVPASVALDAEWATRIHNLYWTVGGREICWQPCLGLLSASDLVVVEQANRLVLNHVLQLRRSLNRQRLAFWGHGANLQSKSRDSWSEQVKARLGTRVDWWFAYTELSAQLVQSKAYPKERITVVQNAIDDAELRNGLKDVTAEQMDEVKRRLGIGESRIALYCGGMHPDKRLEFLASACASLKKRVPDLHVLFVGSGPDQHVLEDACARHPWMHFIGPVYGPRRAIYFAMSQVLLMPGLVGLAVIDSFVAEVPLFTTDVPIHSPEICYLQQGVNGIMAPYSVEDYASAVAQYLDDPGRLAHLRNGCRESAKRYTLDNMVDNFARGVQACLAAERR